MMYPSSYIGFSNKTEELGRDSVNGPTCLRSTDVSCHKSCFSVDECYVLEHLNELRKLTTV